MSFSIVLTCKSFATDGADKRSLISMGAEMRSQIVSTGELLGAEVTLEGSRVLLNSTARLPCTRRSGSIRISKIQNIISVVDR